MQYEVKITQKADEAAYFALNNIPYIVYLNENNRNQTFPSGAYCVEKLNDIDAQYLERVYRRFKGIPWDIIGTERLRIREIAVSDVPRMYELYRDKNITRYMEPLFPEPEQEVEYVKGYIKNVYEFYGYGIWVIEDRKRDIVIGRAGFEYKEGFEGLELGFMLGAEYQHKGYAYEACSAVIRYGINELNEKNYCALIKENNTASIKLCERLGFTKKDTIKLYENNFDGMMVESEYLQYVYSAD